MTIDGPAGAGKTTVARKLAEALDYTYLDTGAMYRAVTLKAVRMGLPPRSPEIGRVSAQTNIRLKATRDGTEVHVDGRDVTRELRSSVVDVLVSEVAGQASVRSDLVRRQRHLARQGAVVLEGRDTGTVVLPDAEVKFFLTAGKEVRAQRRWLEYHRQGRSVSRDAVREQIVSRDDMDESRPVGPLTRPADAVVIDSSGMDPDQVVVFMLCRIREATSRG